MRRSTLLAALLLAALAHATNFPPLTGRVVDAANILSASTRADLTQQLEAFEQRSGIQLVVATVPSLDGNDIETYGVDLARTWQIGSKARNDGAVLLVAKAEHKVRIEVGYGLEGDLTDAMSSYIISTRIVPQFRKGDFDAGVRDGVSGIIEVLGNPQAAQQAAQAAQSAQQRHAHSLPVGIFWLIVMIIVFSGMGGGRGRRGRGGLGRAIFWGSVLNGMSSGRGRGGFGGGGFGGGGGGGFSGGGGSFGGGGASGSW
jgi:uncharacterized protein